MMGFDVGWYEDILLPIIPQSGIHPCKPSSSLDGGIWGMRLAWDWMKLVWIVWFGWDSYGLHGIGWDSMRLYGIGMDCMDYRDSYGICIPINSIFHHIIIPYRIISYIISYHIISYHIISYTISHIPYPISYPIPYHHIISHYHIRAHITDLYWNGI